MAAHHDFYRGSMIESYRFANMPQICANCELWGSKGNRCSRSKGYARGHCAQFRFSRFAHSRINSDGEVERIKRARSDFRSPGKKSSNDQKRGIKANATLTPDKKAKNAPALFAKSLADAKDRKPAERAIETLCKKMGYQVECDGDLVDVIIPKAHSHIEITFDNDGASIARIETSTGRLIKKRQYVLFEGDSTRKDSKMEEVPHVSKARVRAKKTTSENSKPSFDEKKPDIIEAIEKLGLNYVDKRAVRGRLWVIGGMEIADDLASALDGIDGEFHYLHKGGKVSKGKPAWWFRASTS